MVRCDRFIIEYHPDEIKYSSGDVCMKYTLHPTIYDRVKRKIIVEIDTGNRDINNELAEAILTMLNIKYIGDE